MKPFSILFSVIFLMTGVAMADEGAVAATAAPAAKSLTVHTFTFKYKDANKAAAMIKSLMSAEGSESIQPSTNALVVTDRPENVKAITKALADFDVPPQPFHLVARLISAGRESNGARVPDETRDIAPKLQMLGFNSLEDLGSADVTGSEGDPGIVTLPTGYRADFKFGDYDPASDSIQITDFHLSKQQSDQLTSLLKTTLNLRLGQTYILGARNPKSQHALMIVLVARK
jgi:type II/III secretion system protein